MTHSLASVPNNTSPQPNLAISLLAVTVIGLLTGLFVSTDAMMVASNKWLRMLPDIPYTLSVIAALLFGLLSVCLYKAPSIWKNQFSILLVIMVCSLHTMALGIGPLNPLNIGIVLTLAAWILYRCAAPEDPIQSPIFTSLTILFIGCALLSGIGRSPSDVMGGLLVLLPKLLMVLLLVDIIRTKNDIRLILRTFIISSVIAGIVGIVQITAYVFLHWELHLMEAEAPLYITVMGLPLLRAAGLEHTPQGYAQPLLIATIMCIYHMGYVARGWQRFSPVLIISILCLIAGLVLSFARGQWIGGIVTLLVLPIIAQPRKTLRWISILLLITVISLPSGILFTAYKKMNEFTSSSTAVRVELLQAGFEIVPEYPLNGVGIGNFGPYSPTVERFPIHNSIMQTATEMGIPGLLTFLAILIYIPIQLLRAIKKTNTLAGKHALKALLAGYVALFVAIQADPMAYSEFVWFYLALAEAASRCLVPKKPINNRMSATTSHQLITS